MRFFGFVFLAAIVGNTLSSDRFFREDPLKVRGLSHRAGTSVQRPSVAALRLPVVTIAGKNWLFPREGANTAAPIGRMAAMAYSSGGELIALDSDNNVVIAFGPKTYRLLLDGNEFQPDPPRRGSVAPYLETLAADEEGQVYLVVTTVRPTYVLGFSSAVYRLGESKPLFAVDEQITSLAVSPDATFFFTQTRPVDVIWKHFAGVTTRIQYPPARSPGSDARSDNASEDELNSPDHLVADSRGNLFFVDHRGASYRVRVISTDGRLRTIAGGGSLSERKITPGASATSIGLSYRLALAVDRAGNLLIADQQRNAVLKVAETGSLASITVTSNTLGRLAVDSAGSLFTAPERNAPSARGAKIHKISSSGVASVFAGNGLYRYSGDGGKATEAALHGPRAAGVGPTGILYIADTLNAVIRRVSTAGVISTWAVAAKEYALPNPLEPDPLLTTFLGVPSRFVLKPTLSNTCALTVDKRGNLYIATLEEEKDRWSVSVSFFQTGDELLVRRITPAGLQAVVARLGVARGPFAGAGRWHCGLALDARGALLVASPTHNRVYRLQSQGMLVALAGNGEAGFGGDGGPAGLASLQQPHGVAVDRSGNIYIADTGNHRIRQVDTKGHIRTIAGNGDARDAGEGIPGLVASTRAPFSVAADDLGNLYVVNGTGRLRRIDPDSVISTVIGTDTEESENKGLSVDSVEDLRLLRTRDLSAESRAFDRDRPSSFFSLATEATGNIIVLDAGRNTVYRLVLHERVPAGSATPGRTPDSGTTRKRDR